MEKTVKAAFEVGIKLGALFHQFVGVPVSERNAELLERAIESCVKLQPFVVDAEVKIDREKLKELTSKFGYTSLSPEMIYAKVEVDVEGKKVVGIVEWDEKLKYPLMRLIQ